MNRILPQTPTESRRQSYRGMMIAITRPTQTLRASVAVLMIDRKAAICYSSALGHYLQYKTCTKGGMHLIDLIQTADDIAERYHIAQYEPMFEIWMATSMEADNLILDKSTFVAYANPAYFEWEKLQAIENSVAQSEGRTPIDLKTAAAVTKSLDTIRTAMATDETSRKLRDAFESAFAEDMGAFLDYGHLMSPDETKQNCEKLGIKMDS